jgi:hypothetical protein
VFILTFFEKDTFSWYLPETASNLLRVAETLAGAAAGASTEQNRAKPSGTEQNRAFLVLPRSKPSKTELRGKKWWAHGGSGRFFLLLGDVHSSF